MRVLVNWRAGFVASAGRRCLVLQMAAAVIDVDCAANSVPTHTPVNR
jgi:hypothetical protein